MNSTIVLLFLIGAGLEVLQSTLFDFMAIRGVQPDLILIVSTYTAFRYGSQVGQVQGFIFGIVEDATAITPFGFHSLTRLIHAHVIGRSRGTVTLDYVVVPVLFVLVTFIVKTLTIAGITLLFSLQELVNPVWSTATLIEAAYTAVMAPFLFVGLRMLKSTNG